MKRGSRPALRQDTRIAQSGFLTDGARPAVKPRNRLITEVSGFHLSRTAKEKPPETTRAAVLRKPEQLLFHHLLDEPVMESAWQENL
jgi:zona occludens toxin (predicted ATPase)